MTVTATRLVDMTHSLGANGERNYDLTYEVDTNDVNDSVITVRDASGVPSRLTTFAVGSDSDPNAILLEKDVRLVRARDDYKKWRVMCKYRTPTPGQEQTSDPNTQDNPLLQPTKWSGSYVQFTRNYTQDQADVQMKNSAGDPFVDPPVTGDDSRMEIRATKNYSSVDLTTWAAYRDAVNDATWWGLSARKIKVQSITWEQNFDGQIPYYPVSFTFHVNNDTWDVKVLQAGYYEKEAGSGDRTRMKDKYGQPITTPWPLDTDGSALTQAEIDSDSEKYATFELYTKKDFAALGLPATIGAP